MPIYCYQCQDCQKKFEIRHSMSFEGQKCIFCDSDSIFKIPQGSYRKKENNYKSTKPVGKVVDDYIKETKKMLNKEKQELKRREL